jgi:hypothetical protein
MFENGLNRYRMFFRQSFQSGARMTSFIVLGTFVGTCVAKTLVDLLAGMVDNSTPREALFFLVAGVALWTVMVFMLTAVIAYDRYKNDQRQFRKEVGFPE